MIHKIPISEKLNIKIKKKVVKYILEVKGIEKTDLENKFKIFS